MVRKILILLLLITPIVYAREPVIRYVHRPHWQYCGWYNLGETIIINTFCDIDSVLKHELLHYQYFHLHPKERVKFCKDNNMNYDRFCWEYFAETQSLNTTYATLSYMR